MLYDKRKPSLKDKLLANLGGEVEQPKKTVKKIKTPPKKAKVVGGKKKKK